MSSGSSGPFGTPFYIGVSLQEVLYGIELILYVETMCVFLARRKEGKKSDTFYALFSTVTLILTTIRVLTHAVFGQKMWLLNRNYSGGIGAYGIAHSSDPYMVLGTASVIILQQLADGLMIYRCQIVWASRHVIIIPSILWLANAVFGVMMIYVVSTPGINVLSGAGSRFGLVYHSVSIFLNAILTCMICYRLIVHAKIVREYLGEQHASPYFSMVMLLIESVLPFSLSGIAFLVSYGMGSQTVTTLSCVHILLMVISPQMLILRVAKRKAWEKNLLEPRISVTAVTFVPSHGNASSAFPSRSEGSGAVVWLDTPSSIEFGEHHNKT